MSSKSLSRRWWAWLAARRYRTVIVLAIAFMVPAAISTWLVSMDMWLAYLAFAAVMWLLAGRALVRYREARKRNGEPPR